MTTIPNCANDLSYLFLTFFKGELDETHMCRIHIRPSKHVRVPSSPPRVMLKVNDKCTVFIQRVCMYMFPTTDECLSPVERGHVQLCWSNSTFRSKLPCARDICNTLMVESQLYPPLDVNKL